MVQQVEAAEMQLYLGYRLHEADFDLLDAAGQGVAARGVDHFHTVIVGSKIAF
ncbi:MAG: hypothetical protein AB7S74_05185 [Hyphomicrobium sp.]